MRKYILGITGLAAVALSLTFLSWKPTNLTWTPTQASIQTRSTSSPLSKDSVYANYINSLYSAANLKEAGLSLPVFEKAVTGFYNLKKTGRLSQKSVLTIADFDQVSTKKRLYIIDLDKKAILLNTWVAHGQNSGSNEAINFSNKNASNTSSLGFYVTGEVYRGVHGRSLKLDGMDEGFNNNARSRAIVVHGANYVSPGTINALGRLGRSQGCPAVAPEVSDLVINTIGDKTVLFINKTTDQYTSKYLDESMAATFAVDSATQID